MADCTRPLQQRRMDEAALFCIGLNDYGHDLILPALPADSVVWHWVPL